MAFFADISGVETQFTGAGVEFPIPGADILPVFWAQEWSETSRVRQEWLNFQLNAILAIWDELITKFSPNLVEDLDAILAIWDELNYKIFSNHGGRFKFNF